MPILKPIHHMILVLALAVLVEVNTVTSHALATVRAMLEWSSLARGCKVTVYVQMPET